MRKSFLIVSLLVGNCIIAIPDISAQENNLHFKQLGLEDGLSSGAIYSIQQDNQGFMWFGTSDGLNRFDGYSFKVYQHDSKDSASLSANSVWSLYKDADGILWVGTDGGGLNKYDEESDAFISYKADNKKPQSLSNGAVRSIYKDKLGRLWVGTWGGGLNRMNEDGKTFTHYKHNLDNPRSLSNNIVLSIVEDKQGILWIATWGGGLNRYNPETDDFIHYRNDKDKSSISSDLIYSLFVDSRNTLWICTRGGGLNYYDRKRDDFVHFKHHEADPNSISSNQIRFLFEDHAGLMWVVDATDGVSLFDRERNTFMHIHNEEGNTTSLRAGAQYAIYEDNSGNIWFGNLYTGISMFNRHTKHFTHYMKRKGHANSLKSSTVISIYEDSLGELWVGTKKGLSRFDKERKTIKHYEHESGNPFSLTNNEVSALCEDSDGTLWVGTWGGGINYYNRDQDIFQHFVSEKGNLNSLSSNYITAIIEDKYGMLWITTIGGGLNRFSREDQKFTQYLPGNDKRSIGSENCLSIIEDGYGTLWIGTNGVGLNHYDPEYDIFVKYFPDDDKPDGIGSGYVYSIHDDSAGNLWLGTTNGLDKYNRTTEIFTHYSKEEGLPTDIIYIILEDAHSNLWMSTTNGISKFDPVAETFINYDKDDGLQSNEFIHSVGFKGKNGKMYFGGVNGFNEFHPDSIGKNEFVPPVILTDFLLFNKSVPISRTQTRREEQFMLVQSISKTKAIVLDYTDYIFGFEFTALNYIQSKKNQFAYMLEGFDKDWVYVDYNDRKAVYTNIPQGSYTFRVKASNDDGLWNEEGTFVNLTILPPWWETWWAKTLWGLLFIGSVSTIYFVRVASLKRQREQLEQTVKKRTSELKTTNEKLVELDRFKQGMTGMIVHDLKNPLNAILNLTEDKSLGQMSKQMLNMVLNILDVQKFEDSKMVLDRKEYSISKVSNQAMHEVSFLSLEKNIAIVSKMAAFTVKMDVDIMERIFVNLLSNAIKYSQPNGNIEIKGLQDNQSYIRVEITDQGEGIPRDKLDYVFEKFSQVKAKHSGRVRSTGLGLAFCKLAVEAHGGTIGVNSDTGEGTVFWFTLPLSKPEEKTVVSESSLVIENRLIELAVEDKKYLTSFQPKLRKHEIYEISAIQQTLKRIDASGSDGLRNWKMELLNAVNSGNEDRYRELLDDHSINNLEGAGK